MPSRRHLDRIQRRRLLQLMSAGGLGAIAGCTGGDDDETPTETDTDTPGNGDDSMGNGDDSSGNGDDSSGNGDDSSGNGDDTDTPSEQQQIPRWMTFVGGREMASLHGNPYHNPNFFGRLTLYFGFLNDVVTVYGPTSQTENVMAESFTVDGDTATVELRDDYHWHDGEQVTAQDLVTSMNLDLEVQRTLNPDSEPNPVVDSASVVDDSTAEYSLRHEWSKDLIAREAFQWGPHVVPSHYFEHWLNQLEDSTDGDDAQAIVDELVEWDGNDDDGWGEVPVGNSSHKITDWGEGVVFLEPHDGHPNYDHINWNGMVFTSYPDRRIAYLEDRLHYDSTGHPVEPDLQDDLPDGHVEMNRGLFVAEHITYNGGHNLPREAEAHPTHQREVRQALSYIIDRSLVAQNRGAHMRPNDYGPVYQPFSALDQGLIDLDGFLTYDQNFDRAAELLESVGYEEDGGEWYDSDGERFSLNCIGAAWFEAIETAATHFEEFGIEVELENVGWADFSSRREDGEYDVLIDATHADDPYNIWNEGYMIGWLTETLTHNPTTWEVPMPVGNPDGDLQELDMVEEINKTRELTDEDEIWEQFQLLSWAWNQFLPQYDTHGGPDFSAFNQNGFEVTEQHAGKLAQRHSIFRVTESPHLTGENGGLGVKAVEDGLLGHEDGVKPWE